MSENKKDLNFAEFQAHERAVAIGKRYLNIFHQLHVIRAGIEALNKDFVSLPDDVINILPELSGGSKFYQHIKNLKDGTTPMNKIDADLLPFGKDVFETQELFSEYTDFSKPTVSRPMEAQSYSEIGAKSEPVVEVSSSSNDYAKAVFDLIRNFKPTPQDLEAFKSSDVVKDFGPNWKVEIKNLITNDSSVSDKYTLNKNFENLCTFDTALNVWQECSSLVKNPKQKSKEEIKENLEKYKKYLGMFGKGGQDLFEKVQSLIA
ncbi:MAG: hypothetical protein IJ638_01620 [Alphaproteobacteria bacterium]|nr:hypothetical protein [Alphaproteobacteria bacterium]